MPFIYLVIFQVILKIIMHNLCIKIPSKYKNNLIFEIRDKNKLKKHKYDCSFTFDEMLFFQTMMSTSETFKLRFSFQIAKMIE